MSMQQLIDMLEKLTVALNNINVIERRVSDLESRSTDSVDEDMIRETVSGMNFSLDDGDFSGCLDNCSVSADWPDWRGGTDTTLSFNQPSKPW